jgi:hypothetical protein
MTFRSWLESLTLAATEQKPLSPYLKINRKNPQEVQKWQRMYTEESYRFPIAKESFIHFTLSEYVPEILQNNGLGKDSYDDDTGIWAVSTSFGIWYPMVQFNHIIGRKQKVIAPLDMKNSSKHVNKLVSRGWRVPNYQEEIQAIRFVTTKIPLNASPTEVVWHKEVPFTSAKAMSIRDAIQILKHTPYQIKETPLGPDIKVQYY